MSRSDLRRNSNPLLNTQAKVNITHHVWQEDGDYIVACTKEGHIVVKSNPAMRETAQDLHFPKENFISVQLHQHGMVAATHDCAFYIFLVDKTKKVHRFSLLTKWVPKISQFPAHQSLNKLLYQIKVY